MSHERITVDGNEAVARVAHLGHEVISIYPITPASPMGELADAWSAQGRTNLWGQVPQVVEMQSEGGAAGAVHGALQAGALTTTFTASQGLLLMIPNLYKIAGELTPFCLHVAARTVATHALSIFCDHSDVMAARGTGFAMLCSGSVQEAQDFAAVAQSATLASRVPFLHFFDGFRTSHEIQTIEALDPEHLRALLPGELIAEHRRRALTPDRPVVRGTAQNPDVFFQAREACNPYYDACAGIVQRAFERFADLTGRRYRLFDYVGHPEAERVIVVMGSAGETVEEYVAPRAAAGERIGVVKVRLYRPFSMDAFLSSLPAATRSLAILDRTKEPGAPGDPLYLDVVAALRRAGRRGEPRPEPGPDVVAVRYGLSSKEFDPRCVAAVFAELEQDEPRAECTVGIVDDVSHLSLPLPDVADVADAGESGSSDRVEAVFWGLGSDGTVGANKNTIKILGDRTDLQCQGYFVYDSKKSGAVTVSHLRFGREPIHSTYLVQRAGFVACHQFDFLDRYDVLAAASPGAVFLLNSPYGKDKVWDHLPREVQESIVEKGLRFFVIDAYRLASEAGLRGRINTIMQTCFFALCQDLSDDVLPMDEARQAIGDAIRKTYGKRGTAVVERNLAVVDQALEHLRKVEVPRAATSERWRRPLVPDDAPDFVQKVTAVMLAGRGDALPVSAFPPDGTWPSGTSRYEKRNIAPTVPIWDADLCIQCNQCALVCPHAAIRAKVVEPEALADAPEDFRHSDYRAKDLRGLSYVLQVAPEDCTGCTLCFEVCPAKDKANPRRKALGMTPRREVVERERTFYDFFLGLPEVERDRIERVDAKGSQFFQPLFESSGACAGCGETPYVKLLSQLFGDRLLIANATGCSSIYGGNLPTTPWTTNADGRGPAWSNSLFEDNAEFGLGMRLAVDGLSERARLLLSEGRDALANGHGRGNGNGSADASWIDGLLAVDQRTEESTRQRREWVETLRHFINERAGDRPEMEELSRLADYLVDKSVWLVGGDGWAYDIGYGGLDHVLGQGRNVNVLVLDTEVYSNTGGQASKATPLGAAAKFAASGKEMSKKDLGMEVMSYGHVYVARVAFGANLNQTVNALREAESYDGPSLVIAYSPCIAHGYDLARGLDQQKAAVSSWVWPLYRFDPRRALDGLPPLRLDSKLDAGAATRVEDYMRAETRFRMVEKQDRDRYRNFVKDAQIEADRRRHVYRQLAGVTVDEEAGLG